MTTISIKSKLRTSENIALVARWLDLHPQGTRTQLTRHLCEQRGWRDGKKALQMAGCLKALRELETEGYWTLPASRVTRHTPWSPRRLGHAVAPARNMPARAEQVKGLQLIEVWTQDDALFRIWNELMIREHPLHDSRLVGRQLRYLIGSEHGWLGAIGFGSSALYLESRDQWLGWDDQQRAEHHERVINMTRYLIRGDLKCENLASHVLGICRRRVAQDFHARYGVEPWLMETFVDREQFAGTCFLAANWRCVGQTKGRGRNGTKKEGKSIKDVYLLPLVADVPARMGVRPKPVEPLALEDGLEAGKWAEQEFGGCWLGDGRLTTQLVTIAQDKACQPGVSYARACEGNRHQLKSYYRLMNNPRKEVSSATLMQGHREQTIRRLAHEKTALVIQDTMDLNFSTRLKCKGLGQIGTNQTGIRAQGLKMHSALAVSTSGIPLGLLGTQIWAPEAAHTHRNTLPIEQKDSYRWIQTYQDLVKVSEQIPDTHLICVGDRESDIFELFDQRRKHAGRVDVLVRVQHDRCLDGQQTKLFEHLKEGQPDGRATIAVPRQRQKKGRNGKRGQPALPARHTEVEVRFRTVTIRAPKTQFLRNKQPLSLFAISVREPNPPSGGAPIEWLLLTSVQVQSIKQAMKCVRWYCRRWRIEEWHRVLKSGCRILDHQNHKAEVLTRIITLDAVIAWRIMALTLLGRTLPQLPCDLLFNEWECAVLQLLAPKKSA